MVPVLDSNLKRRKVGPSTTPRISCSSCVRRQELIHSGEHINLHSVLKFGGNGKDVSLHSNRFLRSIINSFTSHAYLKIVELLKETIKDMKCPILPSSVEMIVVQSGLLHGGCVPDLSGCKEAP